MDIFLPNACFPNPCVLMHVPLPTLMQKNNFLTRFGGGGGDLMLGGDGAYAREVNGAEVRKMTCVR